MENFEKLTFEVATFYMDSYATAGKNESSRVFLKGDQIFDQYKTYDCKDYGLIFQTTPCKIYVAVGNFEIFQL